MRSTSTIEPRDLGLRPGAKRARKLLARSGRASMPGWFPTAKGTQGALRTESLLEWECLTHFEAHPDVAMMATQPHKLRYLRRRPDGGSFYARYTPDVAMRSRDGRLAVVEVKPSKKADTPEWRAKAAALRAAYAEVGVAFSTWTERSIKVQPRHANVAMMLQHRRTVPDDEADVLASAALLHLGLPASLGDVCAMCPLPAPHAYVDRAYTAVINMALRGEVRLDLSRPLGRDTVILAASVAGSRT